TPSPARRIVQFRAREIDGAVISSSHEHLAVGQQCGCMQIACVAETSGGGPGPVGRIVQFRATNATKRYSSGDEHLAVGQQLRRGISACGREAAGNDKIDRGPLSSQRRAQEDGASREKEKNRANRELLRSVKEVAAQRRKYDEKETSPQRRAPNWLSYI